CAFCICVIIESSCFLAVYTLSARLHFVSGRNVPGLDVVNAVDFMGRHGHESPQKYHSPILGSYIVAWATLQPTAEWRPLLDSFQFFGRLGASVAQPLYEFAVAVSDGDIQGCHAIVSNPIQVGSAVEQVLGGRQLVSVTRRPEGVGNIA